MALAMQVTFDAADPAALAGFWKQVLGYIEEPPPEGWSSWEDWAREKGIPEERWNDQSAIVDPMEAERACLSTGPRRQDREESRAPRRARAHQVDPTPVARD